jgi:toxin CptA
MTSAPAIGFEYRPSRLLGRALVTMLALALLSIALCALAWWLKLTLAALALLLWVRIATRPGDRAVVAAGWADDDRWSLHRAGGCDAPARLQSFRVLGPFVLLRLREEGAGDTTLLLAPDNSDEDIRRRLRMRLAAMPAGGVHRVS